LLIQDLNFGIEVDDDKIILGKGQIKIMLIRCVSTGNFWDWELNFIPIKFINLNSLFV